MDQEGWQKVRDGFHAALELPVQERQAYLESCGAEPEVVQEILALLAHHEDGTLLEQPFARLGVALERNPGRLGPWEILRTLGRGGMGTVFLARRADGAYRGQVAIKLLHEGLTSPELVERFRRERQILADLEHPAIARLIDGGTDDEGRPYLVMEYAEGEPLDVYCDRRRLALGRRLELFCEVARAVHFAHQNLIVHRDLKPGNILAGDGGRLKLLDFGIAKLLAGGAGGEASPTLTGPGPMTPEFASPEQMSGKAVGTASDVYSLGVLLYLLLTGCRPFRMAELSPQAFVEAVCFKDPPTASRQVAALAQQENERARELADGRASDLPRLRRALEGDLDKILAKALRKDPRERYSSAEELARDLERHLEGRPVLAREPTTGYRLGKFLRRHRWAASLVSLALLALSALSIGLLIQRARILEERARGEEVTRFLEGLFEVSAPDRARGAQVTARELLDRGALDIRVRLREQPELQAKLLATMGRVYRQLGLYDEAGPLLDEAQSIRRRLYGEDHRELAEGHIDLGEQALARGLYSVAAAEFDAGLAILLRLGDADPQQQVKALSGLSQSRQLLGDYDQAETLRREAIALAGRSLGPDHELVATNQTQLGSLLRERGRFEEGERAYREALAFYRRLYGEEHPKVATLLGHLGLLADEQGHYPEAEENLRAALAMQSRIFAADHPEIAASRKNLAAVLDHRGLYDEASAQVLQALESRQRSHGAEHPSVADALNLLGMIRFHAGEPAAAEALLRRAIAMWQKLLGERYLLVAAARTNLAQVLEGQSHLESAEAELREALAIYRGAFGDRHLQVATVLNNLAVLQRKKGELDSARRLYEESLEITQELLGPQHPNVATLAHNLAVLLQSLGQPAAAVPRFREALAVYSRILPEGHQNLGIIRKNLAAALLAQGELEAAETSLGEALEIFRRNQMPTHHPMVLAARGLLGEVRMGQGRLDEAATLLEEAFEEARRHHGEKGPEAKRARERLDELARLRRRN